MIAACLNAAWMWQCGGEASAFRRATADVGATQLAVLREILHANRRTAFGTAHGFANIRTVRDFQQRVPSATYEDLRPFIDRAAAGEPNVLTAEPIELFEPTSGTLRGEKLIPYTASLRRQFQRGVRAWIADLFRGHPAVRRGRAYWSISPAMGPPRFTAGGIPIGFPDDTAYLGTLERWAMGRLLAVPTSVAKLPTVEAARDATLRALLAAKDLSLMSVWSPTFLTALLAPLEADRLRRLWPNLALISCWTDGAAGQFLPELRRLFPGVPIQPKGLIATEGMVSFPLVGHTGAGMAIRSHFFEFEEVTAGGFRLADEVERGGRYRVVLTTGGGLYRYQLRDEVEIVGRLRRCPLLRFVGKSDRVSDMVGEKLAEGHVRAVLERLFAPGEAAFAMLVPVMGRPPRYRLCVQGVGRCEATDLQSGLEENPYYRHAVAAGQLAPVEVRWLGASRGPAWAVYERRCLERGQKAGDIKPAVLDAWAGWAGLFDRSFGDGEG